MFQGKINEIFKGPANVFGTATYLWAVGYDKDDDYDDDEDEDGSDKMVGGLLKIYRKENSKLMKQDCSFMSINIPVFGEIMFTNRVRPGWYKLPGTDRNFPFQKNKNHTIMLA